MTAKLYEDKVSGTITEATFLMLIEKSEQERIQKSDRLDTLLSEAGKVQQELSDLQKWTALILSQGKFQGHLVAWGNSGVAGFEAEG